jgi:hypothetical protein
VRYSPRYFGPNANPVLPLTGAIIPAAMTVELAADGYWGFGDRAANAAVAVEVPLAEGVSCKLWGVALERYEVSEAVYRERSMASGSLRGQQTMGDLYAQMRIGLFAEGKYRPAVVFNATLKTASSVTVRDRRYFDTPGYAFDLELGKSARLAAGGALTEVRLALGFGFLCWETGASVQNDASMYGAKLILSNRLLCLEGALQGYHGWMRNGDSPLVCTAKLALRPFAVQPFVAYQYGLHDFPFHHLQLGVALRLPRRSFRTSAPPAG